VRSVKKVQGVIAFIGIGANIGDPAKNYGDGVSRMNGIEGVRVVRHSSLYRTEPVGKPDQPWFVNAVAEIRTVLRPKDLLAVLKTIEKEMGRPMVEHMRWGPRIIDFDILLYGQEVIREEGLTIPHPELHRRRFAMEPLYEIASYVIHPAFWISIQGLRDRLDDRSVVEVIAF
jgi:2-amino-4-hydroxy-6-hydroxymethyldihydropteridine diphosphokinase